MKAVIFSSETDLAYAKKCQKYLRKELGVEAIIERRLPSGDGGHGLMGASIARDMCMGMIAAADHDDEVVARIDSDTVLLPLGYEWLSSATDRARGYVRGVSHLTCMSFAATKAHLQTAMGLLLTAKGNGCSGCLICHALLRTVGIERTRGMWVTDNNGKAESPPEDAHLITLPERALDSVRREQMEAIWAGR